MKPKSKDALRDDYNAQLEQATTVSIDQHPAINGLRKKQNEWIAFFNEQKKIMISAPNVYEAGKSAPNEVLESLRADFYDLGEMTSTRIIYAPNNLSGKIIHNYGSDVVTPTEKKVVVIPVYNDSVLGHALKASEGVIYLQNLFDTEDNADTIAEVLEHISKRSMDDIRLWTPDQGSRRSYSNRAVGFGDNGYGDKFNVGSGYLPGSVDRCSRGMSRDQ